MNIKFGPLVFIVYCLCVKAYGRGSYHHGNNQRYPDTTKPCLDAAKSGNDPDSSCQAFKKCCDDLCDPNGSSSECKIDGPVAVVRCTCGPDGDDDDSNEEDRPSADTWRRPGSGRRPTTKRPTPSTPAPKPITNPSTCGIPEVVPTARVVGGTEAKPHSWPWQIGLMYRNRQICGGSLITSRHVITAAHCVSLSSSSRSYQVTLGVHDRQSDVSNSNTYDVSRITINPNYSSRQDSYDSAILELAQDIQFNTYVLPICLPTTDVAVNTSCEATGWGSTEGTGNNRYLLQVRVPIVDPTLCNSRSYYNGRIDSTMVCAGSTGKDTCEGDSGGPLVCQRADGAWELQGITSWGISCAENHKPGVYSRVTKVLDWIKKTTGLK